jgi:hypothetical protein
MYATHIIFRRFLKVSLIYIWKMAGALVNSNNIIIY